MSPRVLLTTTVRWPSSARLVGAFAAVGARVEALLPQGHVARASRFLSARHNYDPLFPVAALKHALTATAPDLIVPCDDRALTHLLEAARRVPKTADVIARSLGRLESYPTLVARGTFIAAARAMRILAPATEKIRSKEEFFAVFEQFDRRAVLKADGSWGGDGVAVLHNMEQAEAAWAKLASPPSRGRSLARALLRRDRHFLREALTPPPVAVSLQQFVAGTPATTAFACWRGRVLATVHMDVLETLHSKGPATVMRRIDSADMEEAAVKLAERFGLSGLHGLDFIRDADGRAHLVEINPRATQASALALGPRHDLAAALVGAIGPAVAPRPLLTANPVIALFPQEWRRDPHSAWLKTAYPDVPWDDPGVLRACLEPGEPSPDRRRRAPAEPLTIRQAVGR
jgi:hypothetical protein